jgi:hypothetical protein
MFQIIQGYSIIEIRACDKCFLQFRQQTCPQSVEQFYLSFSTELPCAAKQAKVCSKRQRAGSGEIRVAPCRIRALYELNIPEAASDVAFLIRSD